MALTVTATQGGTTNPGMGLSVLLYANAAAPAAQVTGGKTGTKAFTTTGATQLAITPNSTGSVIAGALDTQIITAFTALASTTFTFNATVSGSGAMAGCKSSSLTTASTPVTIGSSAPATSEGQIALAEILASGGTITENTSGEPAAVTSSTLTALTTASFTPNPGDLLVVLVSTVGGNDTNTCTITNTGGLTFTNLVTANAQFYGLQGVWAAQMAGGATATPAPLVKIQPGQAWKVKWVPQGPRQVTQSGPTVPPVPPILVSDTDSCSAADGGESLSTISPVSSADTASAADTGSVIGEGVSSTDVSSASDNQNLVAKPASADTASAADAQATPPSHLSSTDTASAADTGLLRQASADTASAADTGLVTEVFYSSTDTGHGEDSGFAYITSTETSSATDVTGKLSPQAADTATGNDLPTKYWVTDSDTSTSTENGVWSGPISDSDTSLMQEGMPVLYIQDVGVFPGGDHPIATDGQPNPAIDVYTYVPPSVITIHGGFQLVWHHPQTGQRLVLWEGAQLTGQVLARAMDLHTSTDVQFPYDTDLSRSEDEEKPTLGVTVVVQPALNVAVQLS
jgi:hypothetical protein